MHQGQSCSDRIGTTYLNLAKDVNITNQSIVEHVVCSLQWMQSYRGQSAHSRSSGSHEHHTGVDDVEAETHVASLA